MIQFRENFLGYDGLNQFEFQKIKNLLEKSKYGISFPNETSQALKAILLKISQLVSPFERLILFLNVLNQLANTKQFKLLDRSFQPDLYSSKELDRHNAVFTYLSEHFREEISLDEVADLVHLTRNAFCKYFKKMTKKTFFDLVIDFRLRYVRDQLANTDKPIAEICFDSGFGNLSHFNKTFKAATETTPLQYRKQIRKALG